MAESTANRPPPVLAAIRRTNQGVAEAIRTALKERGASKVKENREDFDSTFLVGYRGHLYRIECNYQVIETTDDFAAVGSGQYIATGVLAATLDKKPKQRLKLALEICTRYAMGVGEPYTFEELDNVT